MEDTKEEGQTRYRSRIVKSERLRDGLMEVLADHSTDDHEGNGREGGEPMSKGPIAGKVKQGIMFLW